MSKDTKNTENTNGTGIIVTDIIGTTGEKSAKTREATLPKTITASLQSPSILSTTVTEIPDITQGEWEADGSVVVIQREKEAHGNIRDSYRTTILYEANAINIGSDNAQSNSASHNGIDGIDGIDELNSELEVNARAIAAVPDMISTLRSIFMTGAIGHCLSEEQMKRIADILVQIYDADSISVKPVLTLERYQKHSRQSRQSIQLKPDRVETDADFSDSDVECD